MRKIAAFLLLLVSCSKQEENYIQIPSEFKAGILEYIHPDGTRSLKLEISSFYPKFCQEDSLIYSIQNNDTTLKIQILDTYKANFCSNKRFYLNSLIDIPNKKDSINVVISLGSAASVNLNISTTEFEYKINIIDGIGLVKKYEQTYKVPENLIWGYAYPKSTEPTSITLMNNFKKEIEFSCSTNRLKEGYYSYFSILNNNAIVFSENPGIVGNYITFYYYYSLSDAELVEFFTKIASKYSNLIGYKINTGNGQEFRAY